MIVFTSTSLLVGFCCAHAMAVPADDALRDAKKRVTEADTEVHKAAIALSAASSRIRKQIEASPQWKQAAEAGRQAQSAYAAAGNAVRRGLETQPAYKAAVAERTRRSDEREALRADPKAAQEQVLQAAVALLSAQAAVTHIERDAMAKDPAIEAARANMDLANAAIEEIKKTFADLAAKDQAYQSARQQVDAASAHLVEAQKQLQIAKAQQAESERQKLDQEIAAHRQNMLDNAGWRR